MRYSASIAVNRCPTQPRSVRPPEPLIPLVNALTAFATRVDLFNPYVSRTAYDLDDAPEIRLSNLLQYLSGYLDSTATLILAEAPGPWGCRLTGIPITAEYELARSDFPVRGKKCTTGSPRKEYSSGIFWRVMVSHSEKFLVWNAVPFHPHRKGNLDSIRTPSNAELAECAAITDVVLSAFNPSRTLALGRRPEKQLSDLGILSTYIRHPSQGGARMFEEGMLKAFGSSSA